ncbi:hypothetical protein KOJKO3_c0558 [Klebsiella oxytoca]|nr:hypothetical protein KOJKO3_c0558 [Klebsiella oxytoca]
MVLVTVNPAITVIVETYASFLVKKKNHSPPDSYLNTDKQVLGQEGQELTLKLKICINNQHLFLFRMNLS